MPTDSRGRRPYWVRHVQTVDPAQRLFDIESVYRHIDVLREKKLTEERHQRNRNPREYGKQSWNPKQHRKRKSRC
jgi:hypothetical protein